MNVQTFVDPRNFNLSEISKDEVSSNNSSLMDIQEELKKRNIFDKSFEIVSDIEEIMIERDDKTTPTTSIKIVQPKSPRRPPAQSRVIIKTPENVGTMIEIQQTPTKKKQISSNVPQPESSSSNDTLSGIQEIQKDLQDAGMSWGARLLQRSQEAKQTKQIEIQLDMQSSTSSSADVGKPLSLKDFLRREFLTKSKTDKFLSDDTSLSSQFMQSLLNASSGSSISNRPKSESSRNPHQRHRTSTPVDTKSSEQITTGGGVKTGSSSKQLFNITTADSISSVRDSDVNEK